VNGRKLYGSASAIAVVIDENNEKNIGMGKINSPAYLLSNK